MGSSRLQGKVLEDLAGHTVLSHVLQRCRQMPGSDVVCCATTEDKACDAIADVAEACRAIAKDPEDVFKYTKGEGVDVIIEIVGGEVFSGSIRCLNFRGRLVVVGFTSGIIPELRTNYLLLKNITVMGLDRGQYRDREPNWMRTVQEKIFKFCVEGKISMPIQARFKLNEFIKAFDLIRNREIKGKVLLDIK